MWFKKKEDLFLKILCSNCEQHLDWILENGAYYRGKGIIYCLNEEHRDELIDKLSDKGLESEIISKEVVDKIFKIPGSFVRCFIIPWVEREKAAWRKHKSGGY